MKNKIVFVLGGTFSGIGKGIFSSSLGYLFKNNNQKVLILKLDSYLNCDSKFLDPAYNGEVFVGSDGKELDFDMGHYERFLNQNQSSNQSITLGMILKEILLLEKKDFFEGKKIDLINESVKLFKNKIDFLINKCKPDVTIIELGGKIQNFSSEILLKTFKSFSKEIYDIVTFSLLKIDDSKTDEKINSIKNLNKKFVEIDYYILRSKNQLLQEKIDDFSNLLNIKKDKVFNFKNFYFDFEMAQKILDFKIFDLILKKFNFKNIFDSFLIKEYAEKYKLLSKKNIKILHFLIIDQYHGINKDAYYSIIFSLKQSGLKYGFKVSVNGLLPQKLEQTKDFSEFKNVDGIILPGGFGKVGFEGKMMAVKYARENNIPFLGICYGMQIATMEYFRHVLNIQAHTSEISIDNNDVLIFDYLNEDKSIFLGDLKVKSKKNSLIERIYKSKYSDLNLITERHRHSFVFQNKFKKILENNDSDLVLSCFSNNSEERILGIELKNHPFFVGFQFHPELSTKLNESHPVFDFLIKTIKEIKNL